MGIKPCPFCGSENFLEENCFIYCQKCGARGPYSESNASIAWNDRLEIIMFDRESGEYIGGDSALGGTNILGWIKKQAVEEYKANENE